MSKNKGLYFTFVGASGSGKSTLLNYISENYKIETKEVSARKLLDPTKGSYDEQMCDELEAKINFYYTQETLKNILLAEQGHNIITTRCVIDSLAYTHSLKAAEFLIPQMEEVVEFIKDKVIILYTPCDFPMAQVEDKLRGMNEKIRQETDQEFKKIIYGLNIPHYNLSGSLKERKEKVDNIMKKFNIKKKGMDSIESKVTAIIVKKLGVEEHEVVKEANFQADLGADSLDAIEICMEFEKEFNISIPDNDIWKIKTVDDAITYIHDHSI